MRHKARQQRSELTSIMSIETAPGNAGMPFPVHLTGITSAHISGGIWNHVKGNSFTFNNCKVSLNKYGHILHTSSLSSTHSGSVMKKGVHRDVASDSRAGINAPQAPENHTASAPGSSPSLAPTSAEFPIAMRQIEIIDQLIAPHVDENGIFKRVGPHLRELQAFVGFASTAYTACGSGTLLGSIISAAIDTRMKQCNRVLFQLIIQVARLPHRSFPRIQYIHSIVHQWWIGNEPEEIRIIRLSLLDEVKGIAEWLRCLHS
jgi:hypothetical protein